MFSTSAYIFRLLGVLLCLLSVPAWGQDTTAIVDNKKPKKPFEDSLQKQLRISLDVRWPLQSALSATTYNFEAAADYTWKPDFYWVAEAGYGGVNYDYSNLSYKSNNAFLRLGFDKSLLQRISKRDWDIAFVGLRYGLGFANRGAATYSIKDTLFGNSVGQSPANSFVAHWFEITGGLKLELVPKVFVGWNVRGKFLMNGNAFSDLAPAFLAGYGKGDKNTIFDFSFYVGYAFRWGKL